MTMLFRTTSAIALLALATIQPAVASQPAEPQSMPRVRVAPGHTATPQQAHPQVAAARDEKRRHAAKAARHVDHDEEDERDDD